MAYSAAADAGDTSAPGLGGATADLAGAPRFLDDPCTPDTGQGSAPSVEMGAYENQSALTPPVPLLSWWGLAAIGLTVLAGALRRLWQ